jgi:hypothetical protein
MPVIECKQIITRRLKIEPSKGYTTQEILRMLNNNQANYSGGPGDFICRRVDGEPTQEEIAHVVDMAGVDTGEIWTARLGDVLEIRDLKEAFDLQFLRFWRRSYPGRISPCEIAHEDR